MFTSWAFRSIFKRQPKVFSGLQYQSSESLFCVERTQPPFWILSFFDAVIKYEHLKPPLFSPANALRYVFMPEKCPNNSLEILSFSLVVQLRVCLSLDEYCIICALLMWGTPQRLGGNDGSTMHFEKQRMCTLPQIVGIWMPSIINRFFCDAYLSRSSQKESNLLIPEERSIRDWNMTKLRMKCLEVLVHF